MTSEGPNNDRVAPGLNNLSPPTRHVFTDPYDPQLLSAEDNTLYSSGEDGHERRRRNLRRQGTEIIADEQLRELRNTIVSKLSLSSSSSFDDNSINDLNREQGSSMTDVKQPYQQFRHNIRPGTLGASINDDDDGSKHVEVIQKGNKNVMLIWDTTRSSNKTVFQQIGDQNVVIDVSFLSKACQIQDLQERCIIPIDKSGEVWLEVKRRSQINTTPNGNSNPCGNSRSSGNSNPCGNSRSSGNSNPCGNSRSSGNSNSSGNNNPNTNANHTGNGNNIGGNTGNGDYRCKTCREPVQHPGDYMHPCSSTATSNSFDKSRHSVESIEDNRLQLPPPVPRRPPLLTSRTRPTEGEDSYPDGAARVPEEHVDDSPVIQRQTSGSSSFELDDETYATVQVRPDKISMRLTTPKSSKRWSDEGLLGSVLAHRSIVNFVREEHVHELELSVVEWAYERHQLMYENIPRETNHEMDGPYTVMTSNPPPLPPRNYELDNENKSYAKVSQIVNKPMATSPIPPLPLRKPAATVTAPPKAPCANSLAIPSIPSRGSPSTLIPPAVQRSPSPRTGCLWYCGSITTDEAVSRLTGQREGTFLIRDASKASTDQVEHVYTILFLDKQQLKRIKIVRTNNKFHLNDSKKVFDTLEGLVDAISRTGVEIPDEAKRGYWRTINVVPFGGQQ